MSRRVRLSKEAYDRLERSKRDDETFSEVVVRLTDERSLLELAGIASETGDELKDAIGERRDRRRHELEAVARDGFSHADESEARDAE